MQDKLKDILSNLNADIDQQTLMLYLQGKLEGEQRHEIEKQLSENDFESDAVEGLQALENKQRINHLVEQLNRDLKKKTARKKLRRDKLRLPNQNWLVISALILILLIVLSFFIIHRLRNPQ